MFTISLLVEHSSYGNAVQDTLRKNSGDIKEIADSTGPISRVKKVYGQIETQIDCRTYYNPIFLAQKFEEGLKKYNLVVIFNESSAINPSYRVGDLVIHEFQSDSLSPLPEKQSIRDLDKKLPELKCEGIDVHEMTKEILRLLSTEKMSGRSIRTKLNVEQQTWSQCLDTVMKPNEGILWKFDDKQLCYYLTPEGEQCVKQLTPTDKKKPSVHFGTTLSEMGMYTVSIPTSTPTTHDVQDVMHQELEKLFRASIEKTLDPCKRDQYKVLHVSAIKCLSGADREMLNGYENSVANVFLKFIEEFVQLKK